MPSGLADYIERARMPSENRPLPEFASRLETSSSLETEDLGETLGRACRGGEIIALVGPLGAGKTCLVRGLARGLGVSDQRAASPTFALIHEYHGRMPVVHVDLYRLDAEAANRLGLEEYLESPAVTVIEWADKIPTLLPRDHLRIELEHRGDERRQITLFPLSASYQTLVHDVMRRARHRGTTSA
jgi:tRNA threonylcarbamoyladenosine biosynthesis protein TsaE